MPKFEKQIAIILEKFTFNKIFNFLLTVYLLSYEWSFARADIVPQKNYLQKQYLSFISGPIFITAPHGKRVYRGGQEYGGQQNNEPLRIHQRQYYVSWIAIQLAHKVNIPSSSKNPPFSFCTWGSIQVDSSQKDPNYLLDTMFSENQFHLGLHAWARANKNYPLLHVDIHGKAKRQVCDVDIGIKSIEQHWGNNDPILHRLRKYFDELNIIFQHSDLPHCQFNTNGEFKGYWQKKEPKIYSMTEQAVELGIPSFQMEIPFQIRKQLFLNNTFFDIFAIGITQLYYSVVLPYYRKNEKTVPLTFNTTLADKFKVTIKSVYDAEEARKQLYQVIK